MTDQNCKSERQVRLRYVIFTYKQMPLEKVSIYLFDPLVKDIFFSYRHMAEWLGCLLSDIEKKVQVSLL